MHLHAFQLSLLISSAPIGCQSVEWLHQCNDDVAYMHGKKIPKIAENDPFLGC